MDKTAIKNFAIEARKILMKTAINRAGFYGVTNEEISEPIQKGPDFEIYKTVAGTENRIFGSNIKRRRNLVNAIKQKGFDEVIEETAYTWFNRIIAIRFMEVNDYLPTRTRVLSSETGNNTPDIVSQYLDVDLNMSENEIEKVRTYIENNKYDDAFQILFIKQCNELNDILPGLFEKIDDYKELLLKISYTSDGVVRMLVDGISEDDFNIDKEGQVEIIGWLYQFYNKEQNELVYDGSFSSRKIPKELLPAATTIYTPDWAVRYMTENSLGKIWIEGHNNDELKSKWKFYLDAIDQEGETKDQLDLIREKYSDFKPQDIKLIDPCMGSGHVLVYAFDVFMQIYESEGYNKREAVRSIIENNIYGIDVDDRAFQMTYFAVLMKARQYNRRILNEGIKPNLYSIKESNGINKNHLNYFGEGFNNDEKKKVIADLNEIINTFYDAKEYGSLLVVNKFEWDLIYNFLSSMVRVNQLSFDTMGIEDTRDELMALVKQAEVLSNKYEVVITNPPYLGNSRFSDKLDKYIKKHYIDVKSDLSMAMYKKALQDFSAKYGLVAFITTSAWMFLKSFEKLRTYLYKNKTICSLVDFGSELFDGKVGHNLIVSWVTLNSHIDYRMKAIRLVDYCYSRRDEKESQFFNIDNHYAIKMSEMETIPSHPIAYWVDFPIINAFKHATPMSELADVKVGLQTGNNELFLRVWTEVDYSSITFDSTSGENVKWVPHNKAGEFRKWYGNIFYVVNWSDDGKNIKACSGSRPQNRTYYFREGFSWSDVSSGAMSVRYWPKGCIFDTCAPTMFPKSNCSYLFGLINSQVGQVLMDIMSPTIHYTAGSMLKFPVWEREDINIDSIIQENIELAKEDWDSFEISWDYKAHPIVKCLRELYELSDVESVLKDYYISPSMGKCPLEYSYLLWQGKCNKRFNKLKENEKVINDIFLNVYGLKTKFISEVEDKDVSVRRADLTRDIKSLISYAVGCMFGRYSIVEEGLVYAGGEYDSSKYGEFNADKDAIIPITDEEYFEDDIVIRFVDFIRIVFGENYLESNLQFVADALHGKGKTSREVIRNYFLNEFFKDHCNTYSVTGSGKRPIYWLFDSGKQNGFKCLIYMHRYTPDTVGLIRSTYLRKTQDAIENAMKNAEYVINTTFSVVEMASATKKRDKYIKQLNEMRPYYQALTHIALQRIDIDLDDGVKHNYQLFQGVEISGEGTKKQKIDLLAKI